jgi:hypothetical protein
VHRPRARTRRGAGSPCESQPARRASILGELAEGDGTPGGGKNPRWGTSQGYRVGSLRRELWLGVGDLGAVVVQPMRNHLDASVQVVDWQIAGAGLEPATPAL